MVKLENVMGGQTARIVQDCLTEIDKETPVRHAWEETPTPINDIIALSANILQKAGILDDFDPETILDKLWTRRLIKFITAASTILTVVGTAMGDDDVQLAAAIIGTIVTTVLGGGSMSLDQRAKAIREKKEAQGVVRFARAIKDFEINKTPEQIALCEKIYDNLSPAQQIRMNNKLGPVKSWKKAMDLKLKEDPATIEQEPERPPSPALSEASETPPPQQQPVPGNITINAGVVNFWGHQVPLPWATAQVTPYPQGLPPV